MLTASTLRRQIETNLANRIPSALTPVPRTIRPVAATGIHAVDELLEGGLPLGAITEVVGAECSGRTSFALSFLAGMTQAEKVCAWIDVSDSFDPESAAAASVDMSRLLWVRCGVPPASTNRPSAQRTFSLPEKYLVPPPAKKGLHGGGFGAHPRNEVKGLSNAVSGLLRPETFAPRCAEPQHKERPEKEAFVPNLQQTTVKHGRRSVHAGKPWAKIEQALRVTDLLLQGGGFSAIVLDMGSVAAEYASRVPLATWFRYRAAAEKTQASILLLTQHPWAKSSAELLLRLQPDNERCNEITVFTGIEHHLEVVRRRFVQLPANVVPLRKPPQRATTANWQSQTTWANGSKVSGFQRLIEEIRTTRRPADQWDVLFQYVWLKSTLDMAAINDPSIRGFVGSTHSNYVDDFKRLDSTRLELAAKRVRRAHAERTIAAMNQFPEQETLIRGEAAKSRRHKPLRQIFTQANEVLTTVCPCWMASPLSVCQLIATTGTFDYVIFDQASQVLPEDAVPAILRGKHVIVAGDNKQLPPSAFFSAAEEDDDADGDATAYESLLDMMIPFVKGFHLNWHYRSRDEALISFSNHHIYDDRLVTFPGPGGTDAISHVHVNYVPSSDGQEDSSGG